MNAVAEASRRGDAPPPGWAEVRLGDLITVKHGWPFKSDLFSEELTGQPIIVNIGNFQYTGGFRFGSTTVKEYRGEYPREYELAPGEILLVMTCQTAGGEILGIPARVPVDGRTYLHNQRLGRIVIKHPNMVDDQYLYWLFLSSGFNRELVTTATGTKILHTAPSRIENYRFQLPPLPEQRRIADILGTLDDKIELNRRTNETLEAMARAVFQSWFVDFDPVHAKAVLRRQHPKLSNAELSRRALPNLDPAIAELFPNSFEDSTLGPIPTGWRVTSIGDTCEINGWTLSKNDDLDIIDYIEISEVMRGNIGSIQRFERGQEPSRARRRLRHGDSVLSTVRPDRGAYFLCLNPTDSLIASTGFAVITPRDLPWSLVNCALTRKEVFEHLGHQAHGGAYPAVAPDVIAKLLLTIPPGPTLMERFQNIVGNLFEQAERNRLESRRLGTTRDALLPLLLSGEL